MTGWRRAVLQHSILIAVMIFLLVLIVIKILEMQKNKTELHRRVKILETIHEQRGGM